MENIMSVSVLTKSDVQVRMYECLRETCDWWSYEIND